MKGEVYSRPLCIFYPLLDPGPGAPPCRLGSLGFEVRPGPLAPPVCGTGGLCGRAALVTAGLRLAGRPGPARRSFCSQAESGNGRRRARGTAAGQGGFGQPKRPRCGALCRRRKSKACGVRRCSTSRWAGCICPWAEYERTTCCGSETVIFPVPSPTMDQSQ